MEYIGGAFVYIKRIPTNDKKDSKVFIAMSVPGSKKRRIVEKLGLFSELAKAEGSEEAAEAFIEARRKELEASERFRKRGKAIVEIDLDRETELADGEAVSSRNAGCLFLQKAYYDLGIEPFVNKWKFGNCPKLGYSLNDALRLLVFSRAEDPGSKLAASRKNCDYIEDFDLTVDDLYDCLDRVDAFSGKLTKALSSKCGKLLGDAGEAIYYDCTNFYFEIQGPDGEGGLRDYGVEKNHRPDPIVEYGLLMDAAGYPIGSSAFRGNESEKRSLIPLLQDAGEEATRARIIVADAGLNTEANKDAIRGSGRNYIFCQSPKALSSDNAERVVGDEGGWRSYDEGRKKVKSLWIRRSNGRMERMVVRWDKASADFVNAAVDARVERAEKFIKNPSKLSLKNCQDGKQYIERIAYDPGTGEVLREKSALRLRDDAIAEDRKYAGYVVYVTDIPRAEDVDEGFIEDKEEGHRVVPEDDLGIVRIAGKRNDIESCFRTMKADLRGRPIYVRTAEHIRAHLFTVYLALTLVMYVQRKYAAGMTSERLFKAIRKYSLCRLGGKEDVYRTGYYSKDVDDLAKAMGLTLNREFLTWADVKRQISLTKGR